MTMAIAFFFGSGYHDHGGVERAATKKIGLITPLSI
jgi:hypothetical protein